MTQRARISGAGDDSIGLRNDSSGEARQGPHFTWPRTIEKNPIDPERTAVNDHTCKIHSYGNTVTAFTGDWWHWSAPNLYSARTIDWNGAQVAQDAYEAIGDETVPSACFFAMRRWLGVPILKAGRLSSNQLFE